MLISFYTGKEIDRSEVDFENEAFDYLVGPHGENKAWIASIVKEKFDWCHYTSDKLRGE